MIISNWKFLDSVKINFIVQTLADQLEANQTLLFLSRTPVVNADDDEITGKFKGAVFAADIIADDQEAVVYESGNFQFQQNTIPNLKVGQRVGQGMINRLNRMSNNMAQTGDVNFFENWQMQMAENLVTGIRQRINALICAMQIDSLNYNRLGIQLSNATWGMPSDLKVTSVTGWDDANNSTPITDIQVIATEVGPDNYGEQYDRITMTSRAFRYLTGSAEFQNRIKGQLRYNFGSGQINTRDTGAMRQLLADIVGMEVEIYDGTYWTRSNNGAKVREKVLPNNKVIFSVKGDDNDGNAMDFANGVVTESVVGSVAGTPGFDGEAFGPISYYTHNQDLNPPDIKAWAVARGFARKHRESATAVLTVGSGNAWA